MVLKTNLKIASWNIQGLMTRLVASNSSLSNSKLQIRSIENMIQQHDIICLQETWIKNDGFLFPDYSVHHTIQKTNSKRGCRGVAILIKKSIDSFIETLPSKSPCILWCKLSKQSFGVCNDIYLATVYIPPLNCQCKNGEDILSILEEEILKYQQKGDIMLMGDLNARTSTLNDFIDNDSENVGTKIDNYVIDTAFPKRNNSDISVNKQGERILDLCISHGLRILNGRTSGDFTGKLSCYQHNGSSTVDYTIVSKSLYKHVLGFTVNNLTPYSDHCPISLKLATRADLYVTNTFSSQGTTKNTKQKLTRYVWSENSNVKFLKALETAQIQSSLKKLQQVNTGNIDDTLNHFNEIIHTAAKLSLRIKPSGKKTPNKKRNNKKWYTEECRLLKQKMKVLAKNINPTNYNSVKSEYFKSKKRYKNLVKKTHRKYKNQILSDIINHNDNNNSTLFWNKLRQLKVQNSEADSSTVSEDAWVTHFQNLLHSENVAHCSQTDSYISRDTSKLDNDISDKEINIHINKLKLKKAAGVDGILNEMIKHGRFYLTPVIKKIFNDVLLSGQFPTIWNKGLIKPIYKKGDHSLPSNYRGITLTSCLGKLFTSILQTRLMQHLENNNILNPEQFGFRPNSRTTDNLFILKQLLNKYLSSNEKLYVCFVDYEKAFDTVWHSGLLHKIQNLGITGNFYKVLKSMYSSISSSVLLNDNTISQDFICNKGIRQGDGLSPVLFSLFMNDLPFYLKSAGCKGVNLNNHNFNCLMFADDLMLISSSPTDLQNSMNILSTHANEWKLKVNIDKTKIMIFNSLGRKLQDAVFKYNKQVIDIVDKQTYLGLTLTPSGKFTLARETLVKKGSKVMATVRRMLSNCDHIPITLYCKLFDSLIKPVILYGNEVWGPELLQYKTAFDKNQIEQFHLKFCKIVLGVPWYSPNISSRAEIGRFPLSIDIQSSIYSYYLRLKHNTHNELLKHAFQYSISHSTNFNKITSKLAPNTSNQAVFNKDQQKSYRRKMVTKLRNEYKINWTNNLKQATNDPENYKITGKTTKEKYEFEQYLSSVKHTGYRIALTKLRLGVHKLRIQTGKYENNGKPIPVKQRICKLCIDKSIENEEHFIGYCSKYSDLRKEYFEKISFLDSSFRNLEISYKVLYILKAENPETSPIIGKFISHLFTERIKYI